MRFETLSIEGFGRIREQKYEFSPFITLITGPNESGKSTIHRAIRAALYGIDSSKTRGISSSDWQQWTPWDGKPYGVALTYVSDNGTQYRVTRRLMKRHGDVQVMEIGGGDVTSQMHFGKIVSPGEYHFGLPEQVFCMTAWLGDEGLWSGSQFAIGQNLESLRATLEQIVDTGSFSTAHDAQKRLEAALDIIGTERRAASPLGQAHNAVKQFEHQWAKAVTFHESLAQDQEDLALLEHDLREAERKKDTAQILWTASAIALNTEQLQTLQKLELEEKDIHVRFDRGIEGERISVADDRALQVLEIELGEATQQALTAHASWEIEVAAYDDLIAKHQDLNSGIISLLEPLDMPAQDRAQLAQLEEDIQEHQWQFRRLPDLPRLQSKLSSLDEERVALGLTADTDRLLAYDATSVTSPKRSIPLQLIPGIVLLLLGIGISIYLSLHHRELLIGLFVGGGGIVVIVLAWMFTPPKKSKLPKQLAAIVQSPTLALQPQAVVLKTVRQAQALAREAKHSQEEVQEASDIYDAFTAAVHTTAKTLTSLTIALKPDQSQRVLSNLDQSPPDAILNALRLRIRTFHQYDEDDKRRNQLKQERLVVEEQLRSLERLKGQYATLQERVDDLAKRIRAMTSAASIPTTVGIQAACALFHERAAAVQWETTAELRLREITQQRQSIRFDEPTLRTRIDYLSNQLATFPLPLNLPSTLPVEQLHQLEHNTEIAKQQCAVLVSRVETLRATLNERMSTVYSLADLKDELESAIALHAKLTIEREAILLAQSTLQGLTASTHMLVATELMSIIRRLLPKVTTGRYIDCTIDPDAFVLQLLGHERPDFIPLSLVSHGTRDQLTILFRIALTQLLGAQHDSVPILLDEPLLSADPERRTAMLRFLGDIAKDHQLIITTASPSLIREATEQLGESVSTITLERVNHGEHVQANTHLTALPHHPPEEQAHSQE